MAEFKNALIINGKTYRAIRKRYFGLPFDNPCERCDLKKRCSDNINAFCAPFEKNGFVPYFKLVKK